MKTLIILALSLTAYGQTTGQLCWQPDELTPAKVTCMKVGPAAKRAVADWMATQTEGAIPPSVTPTPKYAGAADLIFSHVRSLIDVAIAAFPPNAIATDKATAATATASAEAKQAALLNRAKVEDPK